MGAATKSDKVTTHRASQCGRRRKNKMRQRCVPVQINGHCVLCRSSPGVSQATTESPGWCRNAAHDATMRRRHVSSVDLEPRGPLSRAAAAAEGGGQTEAQKGRLACGGVKARSCGSVSGASAHSTPRRVCPSFQNQAQASTQRIMD